MKEYEIWMSGYLDQGMEGIPAKAKRLLRPNETDSKWHGINFQQACVYALNELKWEMLSTMPQCLGSCLYDPKNNTYWAISFHDNEIDARKSFG